MRLVIIGAGPAGLTAAETIRQQAPEASITMITAEAHPPYAPPAMAERFLADRTEPLFWKGRDAPERLGVHYLAGTPVVAVRTDVPEVALADGRTVPFDRLLVASGARLYAPLPGHDLPGVYDFKSLTAAEELVAHAKQGEIHSALVVGAGFIGVEVALLLADLGLEVTLIEQRDRVMPRMLDIETAAIVLAELRDRGVDVRLGTRAGAFAGRKRVRKVKLDEGGRLKADVYVAATGVKPNIAFLRGSGVATAWGVVVDDRLRTNVPGVYAAGDVAETRDRMTGERFVHAIFPNAVAQGRVAGLNLLGFDVPYEGAEVMNSLKHLGVPVIAVGALHGRRVLRYERDGVLRKVFLDDGRIVGFQLAGDISGAGVYRSLMLRGDDVRGYGERLASPAFGVGDQVLAAV